MKSLKLEFNHILNEPSKVVLNEELDGEISSIYFKKITINKGEPNSISLTYNSRDRKSEVFEHLPFTLLDKLDKRREYEIDEQLHFEKPRNYIEFYNTNPESSITIEIEFK